MKKYYSVLSILILSIITLYPNYTFASDTLIVCNSCTTTSKMNKMMEIYESTGNSGNKKYLIKDLDKNIMTKYQVYYEPEVGQGFPSSIVTSTDEIVQFYEEVIQWDAIRNLNFENFNSGLNVNAYDVRSNPFLADDIIEDYKNNSALDRQLSDLLISLVANISVGAIGLNASFTFEVSLADGTIAEVRFVGFKNNLFNPQYEIIKLVDSDGNEIPLLDLKNVKLIYRFHTLENYNIWF